MKTELEKILTNSYKEQMVAYLKSHPEDFEEAVSLSLGDKPPYSWRAAWVLWDCIEENDRRMQKYIPEIIDLLPTKPDGQQRGLLMILQKMEVGEELEGKLFDTCAEIWEKLGKQSSLRFNAFKIMLKIAEKYPELSNEIKLFAEDHYLDSLSHAIKRAVLKLVK